MDYSTASMKITSALLSLSYGERIVNKCTVYIIKLISLLIRKYYVDVTGIYNNKQETFYICILCSWTDWCSLKVGRQLDFV